MSRGARRALPAVLAGVLLAAAFLHETLGPLVLVGFVPLLAALDRVPAQRPVRRAFGIGYAFGLAFFVIGTHWIAQLSEVAITIPWLKYPAWIVAALYLALFPAAAAALATWLRLRSGVSLATAFPPAWLVIEWLRGSGEMGFPWFQAGYALHGWPPFLQMASLGGVGLLTAWVVVVNVLAWRAAAPAAHGRRPGRALAAGGALLAVLLPWLWGQRVLAVATAGEARDHTPRPRVALVQANIEAEIKWSGRHRGEILSRFLALSDSASKDAALVIWPETATGSYLRRELDQILEVTRFTARAGVPLFSGYPDYAFDSTGVLRYTNSAGLIRPDGSSSVSYHKRRLVPFGERMPFQRWFPFLGTIRLGQAEWTAGTRVVLFEGPRGPFSCLICFEAIFPDLARADVRAGASWLVNITNDEWFGRSVALPQHAGMAVLRAVENHVPMLRCANTGLTLLVDPYGRVRARLPAFEPGALVGAVPARGPGTPFTRFGDWPSVLALGMTAVLAARRRSPPRAL